MAFPYQQIIYQVTQGDEAAFTQLRTYLQVPAFKFCSVILKDETEAENIIQDVFAKIWDERVELKPDDNFQSYLFLNLKSQIFGRMTKYSDPIARSQYLEKINSFNSK